MVDILIFRCPAWLRHKTSLIHPSLIREAGIKVKKLVHKAGEFMITFPYGYHAGFNHGFNVAESTNFASKRWLKYGDQAVRCYCTDDMVRIDMKIFDRFRTKDEIESKSKIDFNEKVKVSYIRETLCYQQVFLKGGLGY